MFTRKEGSDDTRDVVAQRAVNLPFMTQARIVPGGVITTDKAANGVGGSWTRVTLKPEDPEDLPETRYIYSTVISANQINNTSRLQWLADRDDFQINQLQYRRMEVVRLLPFGSAKKPRQRTLAFSEIANNPSSITGAGLGATFFFDNALTSSIRAAFGVVEYFKTVGAQLEPFVTQFIRITPRQSASRVFALSIAFQSALATNREDYTINGVVNSLTLGYEKGAYSHFGIPYIHYSLLAGTYPVHKGLQQLRYIRARVASDSNGQSEIQTNSLIYESPRGVYYGDPLVVRISKNKLIAVAVNISTQTIVPVVFAPYEAVTDIVVGPAKAFVSINDGMTWTETTAPNWDMLNYSSHPQFIDVKLPDFYERANRPFQTQFLTAMLPWSKTHALGASFFYNNANSALGGEYKAFLMDGQGAPQNIPIPILAYKYVLLGGCRPVGAAIFTFRARSDPFVQSSVDGMYPEVADPQEHFDALSVVGYADRSVMAIYNGDTMLVRPLPWTRLYANSDVFCLGEKEIGTVVFNTNPSFGNNAYWCFSSKDFGVTWKEKFPVDALSDPPSFYSGAAVTQKEVTYASNGYYSLPPQIIFPELVDGVKIPPCPGAPWLNN